MSNGEPVSFGASDWDGIDLTEIPDALQADFKRFVEFYEKASPPTEVIDALILDLANAQTEIEKAAATRKFWIAVGYTAMRVAGVPLPPSV